MTIEEMKMENILIRRIKDSDKKNYQNAVNGWINTSTGRVYATLQESITQHDRFYNRKLTIDTRG